MRIAALHLGEIEAIHDTAPDWWGQGPAEAVRKNSSPGVSSKEVMPSRIGGDGDQRVEGGLTLRGKGWGRLLASGL